MRKYQKLEVNAKELFNKLTDEVIKELSIDEIKTLIHPLMNGLVIISPKISAGTFIYRARKITSTFKKELGITKKDLIYPSADQAVLGRANRDNQSIFYCSLAKEPIFFELTDLQDDDELIVTFWETTKLLIVNNIGYTQNLFDYLGAKRACPTWVSNNNKHSESYEFIINENSIPKEIKKYIYNHDKNKIIREKMSLAFMAHVHSNNTYLYKLSVAIAELHLGEITNYEHPFGGILYPSFRVGAEGDNLALLPHFVDNYLKFKKAVHIKIDSKQCKQIKITSLDHADSFNEDGLLQWLGRMPHWNFQPDQVIECKAVEGVDDDGDYQVAQNGIRCHWVLTDKHTNLILRPT